MEHYKNVGDLIDRGYNISDAIKTTIDHYKGRPKIEVTNTVQIEEILPSTTYPDSVGKVKLSNGRFIIYDMNTKEIIDTLRSDPDTRGSTTNKTLLELLNDNK